MANTPAILVKKLHKYYGKVHALDGLDLAVAEGSIMAVLGPNGAGKTTAVRILTTLSRPNSGRAEVAGYDVVHHPANVRARIGLTGQFAAVDERLTGRLPTGNLAFSPCVMQGRQWNSVKWKETERQVRRLQMRIAKAVIPGYAFIRRNTVGPPPKGCL